MSVMNHASPAGTSGCVLILGPDRSGTSLTANIINELGIPVKNDLPADLYNEKGYWEEEELQFINSKLIEYLGTISRGNPPRIPKGWQFSKDLAYLRASAESVVTRKMKGEKRWGWKDPRLCITLPFWRPILGERVDYLICVRNPLAKAMSEIKRDSRMSFQSAIRLWLIYTGQALINTRNEQRRLLVYYEDYFDSNSQQIRKIAQFLSLDDANVNPAASIVNADLKHHESSIDDLMGSMEVPYGVKLLYLWLLEGKRNQIKIEEATDILSSDESILQPVWQVPWYGRPFYYAKSKIRGI